MVDIWILTRSRLGDFRQMETLARALDGNVTVKRLTFYNNWLADFPFLSRMLLTKPATRQIRPPWPDIVLMAEACTGAIALDIKRRSGGKSKAVCLGRPRGSTRAFDLVITTPQYRLPAAVNVLELLLPLHTLDLERVKSAADRLQVRLDSAPRPWLGLLIGGASSPEILDADSAMRLACDASAYAKQVGGTLLVASSPRTGEEIERVLGAAAPEARMFLWSEARSSEPYLGILGLADQFIITADSISMLTEALQIGRPVQVYRLPRRLSALQRFTELLNAIGRADPQIPLLSRMILKLFDVGILELRPDRDLLLMPLIGSRTISEPGEKAQPPPVIASGLESAVRGIRHIMKQPATDTES